MTSAGGFPPDDGGEPAAQALSRLGIDPVTTSEEIQRAKTLGVQFNSAREWTEEERQVAHKNTLQGLVELGDQAVADLGRERLSGPLQAPITLGTGATLDIWHDGVSSCRGELQFNGARYWLNFTGLHPALDRLHNARTEPGDQSFNDMIWELLVIPSRAPNSSRSSEGSRFNASPVFKSRGLNTGILSQIFVALRWKDDVLEMAAIFNGPDGYEVTLHPNKSSNAQAPQYKGKLVIAS